MSSSENIKNICIVSFSTLASRVTGLVRDVILFAFLGASGLNSAFLLAFTLPNLFRRLLGEGALTSALIPVFTEELQNKKEVGAFRFLNQVLSRAMVVLVAIVVSMSVVLLLCKGWGGLQERWYRGMELGVILMPYMLLVCLAALIAAALNTLGYFGAAALSAVWLNLSMILSLAIAGCCFRDKPQVIVYCLCGGVLVGGVLQAIVPGKDLMRKGWRPCWDWSDSPPLRELVTLFWPGLFGAAIIQINMAVSRLFAFSLDDAAVSLLYLANRLVELPLGMFAIAVTTVIFPQLAMSVARAEKEAIQRAYNQGVRIIFGITIPAALGLVLLTMPILQLLFQWGRFKASDVALTCPILALYALTIPFYAWATFATRGFHSLKDTRLPVKVSSGLFLVNLALSFLFMQHFRVVGLALANLTTISMQAFILQWLLVRKNASFELLGLKDYLKKIALACTCMAFLVILLKQLTSTMLGEGKWGNLFLVSVAIPSSVFLYGFVLLRSGFEGLEFFKDKWKRFCNQRTRFKS